MKKTIKRKSRKKAPAKQQERSFQEIIASAGSDWMTQGLSIDAEVFQNHFSLLLASRDLWNCNPILAKYREKSAADVFGSDGIMLRMKIKETEDRTVYAADEKWVILAWEKRMQDLIDKAAKRSGKDPMQYRILQLVDRMATRTRDSIIRGTAMIEVGAPDVYANTRIENAWKEWQKAKYCDVRGLRGYKVLRNIRLWSCARDGGHFIRLVSDARVNEMGFAIQQVNDEWVDYYYNVADTGRGTTIRLGIEYPFTSWGIGKAIAYYFIKKQPRDLYQGMSRYGGVNSHQAHERVPAEEIIHYARFLDIESTRPAPWGIASFGKIRQLDQYEVAEVVAARGEACKTGWLESDLDPEGGHIAPTYSEIKDAASIRQTPGGIYGLPWGVKFKANDPTHPSGNFQDFRQGMGQSISAALPGGDYNTIFNDLANINFSAGRLGRLDTNEINKMLQAFDIETAEQPIFEAWLIMALTTGYIPLPASKYKKFNKPEFVGRRWEQVDEGKAVDAAAKRIANNLSSANKECAERGIDFESNAIERAEEVNLLEDLGLPTETTAINPTMPAPSDDDDDDENGVAGDTEPKNGKKQKLTKTQRIALVG